MNFCFILDFIYTFLFSVILFIILIPGMVFTIPEQYKDKPDYLSKIIVGATHGSIFIIIFSILSCVKCKN